MNSVRSNNSYPTQYSCVDLELGVDSKKQQSFDFSFLETVYSSDISAISDCLRQGVDPKDFNAAIGYAVSEKKEDVLKVLLGYKTASDFKSIQNQTQNFPLFYEAFFLQEINILSQKARTSLPIFKDAVKGNLDQLRSYTKEQLETSDASTVNGIIAFLQHLQEMRPIHYAALGGNLEAVKLLASRGVNLKAKDAAGNSILHFAALSRSPELIKYVVKNHPEMLNQENILGETPMHYAATLKDYGVLKYLITSGADPHKKDLKGVSPLAILWKMVKNRDPLNLLGVQTVPAIYFVLRLCLTEMASRASLSPRGMKDFEQMLLVIDGVSLYTSFLSFIAEWNGIELPTGLQGKPSPVHEAASAVVPGFRGLKACYEGAGVRDSKKLIVSWIINTTSTIETIEAVFRMVHRVAKMV